MRLESLMTKHVALDERLYGTTRLLSIPVQRPYATFIPYPSHTKILPYCVRSSFIVSRLLPLLFSL
jgi:hypothetical protein